MNGQALMMAPFGLVFVLAGWWMARNAVPAADETIRLEQSMPITRWRKPPGPRFRALEVAGYRFTGRFFILIGSAFTFINLLFGFGLIEPAR